MQRQRYARLVFALTAVVVLIGLAVQVVVTAGVTTGHFGTVSGRIANLLCFFTIQSNLIVGVTSLLLAINPARQSLVFAAFRLAGLVAITVTGIVYHTVLAGLYDLAGAALFADVLLHTVSPVLAVTAWVAFGPRGLTSRRAVALASMFPVAWLALTLIRGPLVDYYPYPFVDVAVLGYPRTLINSLLVGVLFLACAVGAAAVDRYLTRAAPAAARRESAGRLVRE